MKEKALRETQIRNIHEMGEMKRAQELRVDEFSAQKLRENQETIHQLTSQRGIESLWEIVKRSQSTSSDSKFSFFAELRQTLATCTWNMSGPQEHVCGDQFSTFDSSRNHCQGIHHSTTPGATRSVLVHLGTGTPVARDENRLWGTIPLP